MIFKNSFHIQGHRGARGLLPENTIASCCRAVALGANGLEVDVVVSKDNELIVSHEPWMSPVFCSFPNLKPVDTEGVLLKKLNLSEIQKYDCGRRGNPRFKMQEAIKCYKPTFYELVSAVHTFCEEEKLSKPFWNIEVKSHPKWYGRIVPMPPVFVRLLNQEIIKLGLDKTNAFYISSFDPNILREIKKYTPSVKLAFLTENRLSFTQNIRNLGFRSEIYSPYFAFLNKKTVEQVHKYGIKIVTWTVNDPKTAAILRGWKVDGLITDYPNIVTSI